MSDKKTTRDFSTGEGRQKGFSFPITESVRTEKRVTVSRFKGKVRIDIREYYLDDANDFKPGKRGLSLDVDQWTKLLAYQDLIKEAVYELEK
jgi:hypothetical protein